MARKKLIWCDKRSSHGLCNEMEFATFSPPEIPTLYTFLSAESFLFCFSVRWSLFTLQKQMGKG